MPSERRPARPGICDVLVANTEDVEGVGSHSEAGEFAANCHDGAILLSEVFVKSAFKAGFQILCPWDVEKAACKRDAGDAS